MKRLLLLACAVLIPFLTYAVLPVGEIPPEVTLEGEDGGRLDGTAWSSSEIKDKVYVLFYVDPDESDLNNHVSDALEKEKFPEEKYASIAIINMDATWAPNFIIQSKLEDKQKKFPTTIYVKDMKKKIVEQWKLADDNSDITLFDKTGSVLFSVDGKLTNEEVQELIRLIQENL